MSTAARPTRGRGTRSSRPRRRRRRRGCRAGPVPAASARATAPALPSPLTRNHTDRLRLRAPKVRLTRSGRRLGGVGDADGDLVVDVELGGAREQRGDVAVGAHAEHQHLERAGAVLAQRLRSTPPRPRRRIAASAVEGISWTLAGSNGSRSRNAARASPGVAVLGVGRHEPLVAPPDDHPRPVDLGAADPSGRARGARPSAMVPPVSPICGSSPRAWASSSRVISSPADGRRQVGGVDVDLDPRSGAGRDLGHDSRFFANARATPA